tara:strand:+ start:125 stop:601 length:477 start_codon:yes stop_codon:yes gene_type:complete
MPGKKRERSKKKKILSIVKKYNFEFLISFLVLLGSFLLLEDFELKKFLKNFSIQIYEEIKFMIFLFLNSIFEYITKIESSDIIGLILIFSAIILMFLRWRNNLIYQYSSSEFCFNCKGKLQRIKRKVKIKIIASLIRLKIKKYQCRDCKLQSYKITSK